MAVFNSDLMKGVGGLALVLAPLLAVSLPNIGQTPLAEAKEPAQVASAGNADSRVEREKHCVERFLDPFQELASSPPDPGPLPGPWRTETGSPRLVDELKPLVDRIKAFSPEIRLDVRIATIADPIDSGLGYLYDTSLQALRLGFERGHMPCQPMAPPSTSICPSPTPSATISPSSLAISDWFSSICNGASCDDTTLRYNRDRSWLPWEDRALSDRGRKSSEDCRSTTPGVVLFRGANPNIPALGILLLVGETPTAGVHRRAFSEALSVAQGLQPIEEIKIIGPMFSGSAPSLGSALEHWASGKENPPPISIISGSASGPDVPRILNLKVKSKAGAQVQVSFKRTTIPQSALECEYLTFVHEHLGIPSERSKDQPAVLGGVAFLRESGTEFGSDAHDAPKITDSAPCSVAAEVTLTFPFGISAMRDAYEEMDAKYRSPSKSGPVEHHTALEVSLKEKRKPLDVGAEPSQKTVFAEDIALSNLLAQVSHEGIRYVAIQATDIADSIFLARKIRDIAPDVRLAFLSADALLVHPAYRKHLLGSFVVSPYPFFGADAFSPRKPDSDFRSQHHRHTHNPFANELVQGTYNAVLATGNFPADDLAEYSFFGKRYSPLPVWISTISNAGLIPIRVTQGMQDGSIYGIANPECKALTKAELDVDPDVTPPKFWHTILVALAIGAIIDRMVQRGKRPAMPLIQGSCANGPKQCVSRSKRASADSVAPSNSVGLPFLYLVNQFRKLLDWLAPECQTHKATPTTPIRERDLDLSLGRTKYRFYTVIRSFTFVLAFGYMGCIQTLALASYGRAGPYIGPIGLFGSVVAFGLCCFALMRDIIRWRRQRCAAGRLMNQTAWPEAGAAKQRTVVSTSVSAATLWALGIRAHVGGRNAAKASFAQLRLLTVFTLLASFGFVAGICRELQSHHFNIDILRAVVDSSTRPCPDMTMFVLRSLPLVNGVSPSAPILLTLACVYVWVVGRMARLQLAHGVSLISPDDNVRDAVSTPISFILNDAGEEGQAGALRDAERGLVNAIWRPRTGPRYFGIFCCIIFFPFVLFILQPPSTLESETGTALLFGALGLCAVLIAATLLQLVLYWLSLELLLKRIAEHPIGRAFRSVAAYARDSVEDLVSRTPHDLLRLTACARTFDELCRSAKLKKITDSLELEFLTKDQSKINDALSKLGPNEHGSEIANGSELGPALFVAANHTCHLLSKAWKGTLKKGFFSGQRNTEPDPAKDALTPIASGYTVDELTWLRDAQSFVATSVAVILGRHVRQFKYFLYALTGCATLLLLALTSYAYEPHRLLLTSIWIIMTSVVATCFWVFLQLDLNTLLSNISNTDPGKVTFSPAFFLRVVGWVVVPLLSVAAAQYPQVASTLLSWLEPFTRTMR